MPVMRRFDSPLPRRDNHQPYTYSLHCSSFSCYAERSSTSDRLGPGRILLKLSSAVREGIPALHRVVTSCKICALVVTAGCYKFRAEKCKASELCKRSDFWAEIPAAMILLPARNGLETLCCYLSLQNRMILRAGDVPTLQAETQSHNHSKPEAAEQQRHVHEQMHTYVTYVYI